MKINYEKLKELNNEALTMNGEQLQCFYIIQAGVERFLSGETISEDYKNFLIDLGVFVVNPEEKKQIVQPFNFMGNDGTQGN